MTVVQLPGTEDRRPVVQHDPVTVAEAVIALNQAAKALEGVYDALSVLGLLGGHPAVGKLADAMTRCRNAAVRLGRADQPPTRVSC